ncbi:MAG: ABC transporter ATP-binding protein [Clostridia bacterium]|nr:ABC transporter ATP-binding protein [Clostridia bacterium]
MIHARGLRKTYQSAAGRVDAVDAIDLDIAAGEFTAIVGSSGSGKSTLLNILGLLDRADSGKYTLNGHEISRASDRRLTKLRRNLIGFIFQNYNLVPRMTALENVELGLVFRSVAPDARRAAALAALDLVGLSHRIHHYPSEMSGGQQQRVAIARALANSPRLILADEPTGNLDAESAMQVTSILKRLNETGVTIVLITHDAKVAQSAGRTLQIHTGKIIGDTLAVPPITF